MYAFVYLEGLTGRIEKVSMSPVFTINGAALESEIMFMLEIRGWLLTFFCPYFKSVIYEGLVRGTSWIYYVSFVYLLV